MWILGLKGSKQRLGETRKWSVCFFIFSFTLAANVFLCLFVCFFVSVLFSFFVTNSSINK